MINRTLIGHYEVASHDGTQSDAVIDSACQIGT